MTKLKTQPNDQNVVDFINALENKNRRTDALLLLNLFENVTERSVVMWGDAIIGFGSYQYTNTKGTYDWLMTGFSPRKQNLTIYMQGFDDFEPELQTLGNVKHSKSCLYLPPLNKIDLTLLEQFLKKVVRDMREKYDCR